VHSVLQTKLKSSRLGPLGLRFRSIVVATDYSAAGTTAVKLAARMAKQFHARLCVLHAIMPELYAANMAALVPQLEPINLQMAPETLHRHCEHVPDVRCVKHKEIVFFGSATDGIQQVSDSEGADLLVLGSHGRHGLAKLALGSIAEWAMRRLGYPVLVAGPMCDDPLRAIRSIVLATDLLEHALPAAAYASSIAQEHNARLTVMTVASKEEAETELDTVAQLHRILPSDCRDWCTLNFEVKSGEVSAAILECAQRRRANLVVLGAGHGPILADHVPSTTLSTVVRGAHCPVLVVPASCS